MQVEVLCSVQVEVHGLENYQSTSKEKMLKEVSRSRIIENNKYGRSKEEISKVSRILFLK